MNPIELGKFLANLRNEKGLTQEELAEKLYIDKRKISRWECGTSIPEFEMLIKLSEILDISLYELSICKRIPKDKINRKLINRFKTLKDLKKYKSIIIIKYILLFILFIFFIITTIYTFKNSGTVEVYEFKSLDENYITDGNYTIVKDYIILDLINFVNLSNKKNIIKTSNECDLELFGDNYRMLHFKNTSINMSNRIIKYDKDSIKNKYSHYSLTAKCTDDKNIIHEYKIKIKMSKIFDNKLF